MKCLPVEEAGRRAGFWFLKCCWLGRKAIDTADGWMDGWMGRMAVWQVDGEEGVEGGWMSMLVINN